MSILGETVKIYDSTGQTFTLDISTPTMVRLSFELSRNGNFTTWRPHFWGGDWEAIGTSPFGAGSGQVWYRRSETDFGAAFVEGAVKHIDIFLMKGDESNSSDDWGVVLRGFFALNGTHSSGGRGWLNGGWAGKLAEGRIGWDIPGRYKSA